MQRPAKEKGADIYFLKDVSRLMSCLNSTSLVAAFSFCGFTKRDTETVKLDFFLLYVRDNR